MTETIENNKVEDKTPAWLAEERKSITPECAKKNLIQEAILEAKGVLVDNKFDWALGTPKRVELEKDGINVD